MRYEIVVLAILVLGAIPIQITDTYISAKGMAPSVEDPIVVVGDSGFTSELWQGEGTASSPYILEDVQIETNVTCISITNTTAYFVIRDCVLDSIWHEDYATGYRAIDLWNVTNGAIEHSNIHSNASCIYLSMCLNVNVTHNTLRSEKLMGVMIYKATECSITSNVVDSSNIEAMESQSLRIESNWIYNNSVNDGIDLHSVTSSMIVDNEIQYSANSGIHIADASSMNVSYNRILGSSSCGMILSLSNSSINGNHIEGSHSYGMDLEGNDNSIKANLFLHNDVGNARNRGRQNIWEGNYYDDYSGIGSYAISGDVNAVDSYPQGYPGIPTPAQISVVILVPVVGLVTILVVKRNREGSS